MEITTKEKFDVPVIEDLISDWGRMEARGRIHPHYHELVDVYSHIIGPAYQIDGVKTKAKWYVGTRVSGGPMLRQAKATCMSVTDYALDARFRPFSVDPEKSENFYVSANMFVNAPFRYTRSDLFALRNIVLDLDYHQDLGSYASREEYIADVISRANQFLPILQSAGGASAKGIASYVPTPNLVVYTGRGLQLWYYLDPSSAKLTFFVGGSRS